MRWSKVPAVRALRNRATPPHRFHCRRRPAPQLCLSKSRGESGLLHSPAFQIPSGNVSPGRKPVRSPPRDHGLHERRREHVHRERNLLAHRYWRSRVPAARWHGCPIRQKARLGPRDERWYRAARAEFPVVTNPVEFRRRRAPDLLDRTQRLRRGHLLLQWQGQPRSLPSPGGQFRCVVDRHGCPKPGQPPAPQLVQSNRAPSFVLRRKVHQQFLWGAKGLTLLTSDYMATCRRSPDTLVPALLGTCSTRCRGRGKVSRQAPLSNAANTAASKYNSIGASVTLSEKSASSYE